MHTQSYLNAPDRARFTFHAVKNGKRLSIHAVSFEAVMEKLRELCPNGSLRELWEVA